MKMRWISGISFALFVCAFVLGSLSGCRRVENRFVVGVDLYHGRAWPNLVDEVQSFGFACRLLETPDDFRRLDKLGVLMICTKGAETTRGFSSSELKEVVSFVKKGGGLLCADQSWSWTMKEYGNKPLEDFPLNRLGEEFGFRVLDNSVRAPRNLSPKLLAGIGEVSRSTWWPSEIELFGDDPEILITDEQMRPMMGTVKYGRGRVAVVGSADLLAENPRVLRNLLLYLTGVEGGL